MRNFILLIISGLLVITSGGSGYAQKIEFRASGFTDAASFLAKNVPYAYDVPTWVPYYAWLSPIYGPSPLLDIGTAGRGHAFNKERSLMQTRVRLKLDAIVDKSLSGTLFLEGDSGMWGESGTGRNNMGRWSADQAAVEIKNAYFDFGIPGIPIPATLRVGLQPLNVRPAMVVYNDGMGVTGAVKIDPVNVSFQWFKQVENQDYSSDDTEVYGLGISTKIEAITIGGYGLYYNSNTYPIIPAAPSPTVDYTADMWWLGAYVDGKMGPIGLNFDVVADTGVVEDRRNVFPRAPDVKYRGWATRLKAEYPWENFNFGVLGIYASGPDQKKTDPTGFPGKTTPYGTTTTRVSGYVVPTASEQFGSAEISLIMDGYPVWPGYLGYNVLNYNQMHRGSIGGIWAAKFYGSYKAAPWYKVTLAGIYIGDTTKNGNTLGDARTAAGLPRDDKSIGFELDLINEIMIYKNLKWAVGFGYLIAGDGLEYYDRATGRNKAGKDPWALVTRLTFTF